MLNYSAAVDYSKIITIEPGKRNGKPCIRGMRITVQDVFEYLAGGMTEDQILEDFPELTREDINACFAFAANRERKLFVGGRGRIRTYGTASRTPDFKSSAFIQLSHPSGLAS